MNKVQKREVEKAELALMAAEKRLKHLLARQIEFKKPRRTMPENSPDWDRILNEAELDIQHAKDRLDFIKKPVKPVDPVERTKGILKSLAEFERRNGSDDRSADLRASLQRRLAVLQGKEPPPKATRKMGPLEKRIRDLESQLMKLTTKAVKHG